MTHLIDELRRMAGSLFDVPSQEIVFTMRSRSVTVSREQGSETILVTKLADYYRDPAEDPWANLAKCLAKKASERQATARRSLPGGHGARACHECAERGG